VSDGHYQEGMRELFTAIEQNQNLPFGRNSLGVALHMLGRKQEAIEQFQESIRLQPANAEAHTNLGNSLLEEGNLDDAIREYTAAVGIAPAMPNAYYGLGCVRLKQN